MGERRACAVDSAIDFYTAPKDSHQSPLSMGQEELLHVGETRGVGFENGQQLLPLLLPLPWLQLSLGRLQPFLAEEAEGALAYGLIQPFHRDFVMRTWPPSWPSSSHPKGRRARTKEAQEFGNSRWWD
jgi:hypothetical protein